jgi:uncharacterized protein YhaN
MRFNRLDVLRYGALTDRALEFREGARLHVVYGPNEAGKSSALNAISDLLFGFPTSVEQSFLHEPASLRIGAAISARDGATLDFRRRRGRKNTLIAHTQAEQALADDALSPFLGSLHRDVFERAFGLNSHRLRQGAAAMLRSGGEIGSLLFSAASGLTGLTKLRQSLDAEAESIFAPRRSKDRLFYQVLDRHDEARKAERDNELKSGDWKKLITEAADADGELAALQAARQATKRALDHLRMLKKLEPLLREIDSEQMLLQEFSDLKSLPPSFEDHLARALQEQKVAGERLAAAIEEEVRLGDELSAAHVDEAVYAAADAIVGRYSEKGAYLKAKEDLSRVRGEVEDFDLRLSQLARKLGLAATADELERRQPADAELARVRKLTEEGRELRRAHADIRKRLEEERDYLRHLDSLKTSGRLIDPKPYAEQLAALQPDLAELGRLDAMQVRVSRGASELKDATARLLPEVVDLDRLLAQPLPDIATLTEHRRLLDQTESAAREAEAKQTTLLAEKESLLRDIAHLERGGTITTREEIAAARKRRDALWQAFAAVPALEHVAGIDQSIREADRLADLALADAESVARHAQLKLRQGELEEALAAAQRQTRKSGEAWESAKSDYAGLFAAAGILPLGAEAMIEWRRAVEGLGKQREALHGLKDELAALRLTEERIAPVLATLADACDVPGGSSLPPLALGRALSRHIGDLGQRWTESRSAEGKRHSAVEAVEKLEAREASLKADASRWEIAFAEATAAIGLSDGATVEMAEAAFDVWKDVPPTLAERENRHRRVRGMLRDIGGFEDGVRALLADVGSELASLSPDAVVDILHQRAVAANADQQRRTELSNALERVRLTLTRRRAEAEEAETALSDLAKTTPDTAELGSLLHRLQQRHELEGRLVSCRRRFVEQADGQTEEAIRAALSGFDRVEAELEIERLEAEDNSQIERFGQLTAQLAENQRQRRELETGKSAEYAVFEKLSAEQEAKDLARQWVVLKLSAYMLGTSMESYREAQADPVMTRAGALFSTLTGGRFARLVQEYGADDELHLQAERAAGERVPLDGLSEGTGDQLYLALRLAFLEDYSARNEPAPLIVDDIFQTFDDDRTASGLKALASTAGTFQTILFTHQTSVVDIAQRELKDGLDLIQL